MTAKFNTPTALHNTVDQKRWEKEAAFL